jgi:hypothetical protein
MIKCGKTACACHSDPDKCHGPYFELTYKANGKRSAKAKGKTIDVKLAKAGRSTVQGGRIAIPQALIRLEKLSPIILRQEAKQAQSQQRG